MLLIEFTTNRLCCCTQGGYSTAGTMLIDCAINSCRRMDPVLCYRIDPVLCYRMNPALYCIVGWALYCIIG
jgi:hypothetical protein